MHWINAVAMMVMITSGWGIYDDDVDYPWLHFGWLLPAWGMGSLEPELASCRHVVPRLNGLAYLIYGYPHRTVSRTAATDPVPNCLVQPSLETLHFKIAHEDLTVYNAVQKALYIIVILAGISSGR